MSQNKIMPGSDVATNGYRPAQGGGGQQGGYQGPSPNAPSGPPSGGSSGDK